MIEFKKNTPPFSSGPCVAEFDTYTPSWDSDGKKNPEL
jgi:hypothetical protein